MRVVRHETIARYFQQQADQAQDQLSKARYQLRADEYHAKAERSNTPQTWSHNRAHREASGRILQFVLR
jgi:hypothetical protein